MCECKRTGKLCVYCGMCQRCMLFIKVRAVQFIFRALNNLFSRQVGPKGNVCELLQNIRITISFFKSKEWEERQQYTLINFFIICFAICNKQENCSKSITYFTVFFAHKHVVLIQKKMASCFEIAVNDICQNKSRKTVHLHEYSLITYQHREVLHLS